MNRIRKPCVWITGMSGAGKSTLAKAISEQIECCVLDADWLRLGINSDLGFSAVDRRENVRRIAHIARIVAQNGVIPVVACISPLELDRDMAKDILYDGRFIEVFVDTPLAVCQARDTKGLYQQAESDGITDLPGLGSRYERPKNPTITIEYGQSPYHGASQVVSII